MKYSVYVRAAAERDVAEAQRWYEEQRSGLAAQFLDEFSLALERLAEAPLLYPVLYRGVRRAVLHRFPYLLWYRVQDSTVTVLSCTHGRANPAAIPGRLR